MSTDPLSRARDLLNAKQYAEARAILVKLNSPTARQWLAKLDAMSPVPPAKRTGTTPPSKPPLRFDDIEPPKPATATKTLKKVVVPPVDSQRKTGELAAPPKKTSELPNPDLDSLFDEVVDLKPAPVTPLKKTSELPTVNDDLDSLFDVVVAKPAPVVEPVKKTTTEIPPLEMDDDDDPFDGLFDAPPAKTTPEFVAPVKPKNSDSLIPENLASSVSSHYKAMTHDYWALKTIATLYIGFGALAGILGTIIGVTRLFDRDGGLFAALISVLSALVVAVTIIAGGQLLQLLVELALNSRRQVALLEDIKNRS